MSNKRQLSSRLTYAAETPKFLRGLVDLLPNARSTLPVTLLGHIPDPKEEEEEQQPTAFIGKEAGTSNDKEEKDDELADEWNGPEEERPQIVVLRKGKHLSEEAVERELGLDQKEAKKKDTATGQHDDQHSSDDDEARGKTVSEDGRLLFRPPKKTKRTTGKESDVDESKKRKKARKTQKASSKLLSFQTDDA
ncbi:hypothetical protein BDF22DRAFT_678474 [Syncephalis plumigaleata]|nr:hypothetical protein BDF22DRAFT_678474 [Syncephalis plumigaleata]